MFLTKIYSIHYSPKDHHIALEEMVVYDDEEKLFQHIASVYNKNIENKINIVYLRPGSMPSISRLKEEFAKIISENFYKNVYGDYKGEEGYACKVLKNNDLGQEVEGYYGETRYDWGHQQTVTKEQVSVLEELGLITIL